MDWKLVATGVALQIAFAAFVLMTTWGGAIFEGLGKLFVTLIGFTTEGSKMILGGFANQDKYGFVFIFHVWRSDLLPGAALSMPTREELDARFPG